MNTKNLEKNGYYENIVKYYSNIDIKKMNECPCDVGYVDIDKKNLYGNQILNNKQNSLFSVGIFDKYFKKISGIKKKSTRNKKNLDSNINDYNNINNCHNKKIENKKLKKKNIKLKTKNIAIMLFIVLFYLKFVKKN
jgi:hypothetical protein